MRLLLRLRDLIAPSLILLLALTGCSSDPGPGDRSAGPHLPPPAPLAGQDSFFDGQILAEVNVSSEGMPEGGSGGGKGKHNRREGGGAMSVSGGNSGMYGNISGGIPLGAGGDSHRPPGGRGGGPAGAPPMAGGAMGRPVMIHLRFTNRGASAVTLRIDDFTSPLGSFAVRPEKLEIAPGQSLETEPMASQLGGTFTEADASLALRIGDRAEKKTFRLLAVVKEPEPKPEE
jgi:hypothetical protein